MKHIKNIIRILVTFFVQLVAILFSPFIVGTALLLNRIEDYEPKNETSRPNHKFKDKWIDAIYGNKDDGIDGDIYYLQSHVDGKRNFWTRFRWTVLRNPVHNLGLKLGFDRIPVKHIGFRKAFKNSKCSTKEFNNDYENCLDSKVNKTGFEYTEVYDENNKMYPMYRLRWKYPFTNHGLKCNIGWKNWNVGPDVIGKPISYTFTFLINPFKKFKK